jgi:hypothetical protein
VERRAGHCFWRAERSLSDQITVRRRPDRVRFRHGTAGDRLKKKAKRARERATTTIDRARSTTAVYERREALFAIIEVVDQRWGRYVWI